MVPLTISREISRETSSRFLRRLVVSLMRGATPGGPTSCSTREARSRAWGISTWYSGSRPFCLAWVATW